MAMPVLTEMGVTASLTAPTTAVTQPEMGTFMPPFTAGVPVSTSILASSYPQFRARNDDRITSMPNFSREQPYGMPTSLMINLHDNEFALTEHVHPFTQFNSHSPSSSSTFGRNALPALTTKSMMCLRQQMDESSHEMVNLLIQQISTVFNPLIQNTNQSYQALAIQMGRIADFFSPPQTVHQQISLIQNIPQIQNPQPLRVVEPIVQKQQPVPQPQPVEPIMQA